MAFCTLPVMDLGCQPTHRGVPFPRCDGRLPCVVIVFVSLCACSVRDAIERAQLGGCDAFGFGGGGVCGAGGV